jgi:hypothetical protein
MPLNFIEDHQPVVLFQYKHEVCQACFGFRIFKIVINYSGTRLGRKSLCQCRFPDLPVTDDSDNRISFLLRPGVGPQQHIGKSRKDTKKHQYFGLNRSIFMQKLAD